ncbi:NAD(+) synthase [Martelella alba]|uniref:Glutamine-dependent NAD(+) synthetase n=1 Tax=Martelella alba TaxID=2590451 RepID=A0ABY2SIK8_9HYPH|nr:NAD(+) synthase [Martelella alba]TKI05246.1 NAD(+) synthase [Martelella alba]
MSFRSLYQHGFARVAACTVPCALAEPSVNARAVADAATSLDAQGVALAIFPELALCGYSIEDLLLQDVLLDAVERAVGQLLADSADLRTMLVVGAPLRHAGRIYNTALVMHRGRLLGIVPKSYLPTYREFYERRQCAPGDQSAGTLRLAGQDVPFGPDLLFAAQDVPDFVLHVEICEDFWVPIPPSAEAALAGATVLANLSGSPITIGRADTRRQLCRSQSLRCLAAYLYAAAGVGESTTEVAWDGQCVIYENGELLAQTPRFTDQGQWAMADIDLDLLRQERIRMGTFDDNRRTHQARVGAFRRVSFTLAPRDADYGFARKVERFPFVPADRERLSQDCYEAYNIQVAALTQRVRATGVKRMVIGVSGGLDSTQALIVATKAADRMQMPREHIIACALPGFGTGDETRKNALSLIQSIGATYREIDIRPAANQMLADIGHPYGRGEKVYDVTFENVQAGLRTDYLFRLANHVNGIVVGTGDLSEMALGWCTYGVGDQMSHYHVNAGVPKTLIQHLIRWVIASGQFDKTVADTLEAILATEISPELVPADAAGAMQSTEAIIGPYDLQDFNLFYTLRYGFRPSKIAFLALHAWSDAAAGDWPPGYPDAKRRAYPLPEIRRWLRVFLHRFFTLSQFKRSASPNGPKVTAGGSLSPRGDWRAPSDGNARIWIEELESGVPEQ